MYQFCDIILCLSWSIYMVNIYTKQRFNIKIAVAIQQYSHCIVHCALVTAHSSLHIVHWTLFSSVSTDRVLICEISQ